ncbi:lactonase family protein [Lactobacillus psittaci]|uniref:6-Phosphogluconolactonase n=1 Tax=Lactobacillus psittaci DSM 15354 TaxID=1122152 RepID=A0A0R1SAX6_9LACO|nr:lactonase family protein [Lactobacillus psittaci]KRL63866.1 6-Phosphogluconolactonase [Lactobacillus psittaci DSM 15354]
MQVFIGGYTKTSSQGIYQASLNNGKVSEFNLCLPESGPTYLKKDGNYLISISKKENKGGIDLFDLSNKKLRSSFYSDGASPAYIGINRKEKLIFTANYHTAYLSVFSYQDGKLKLLDQVKHQNDNLGPRPEQVDGAHPHFFDQTPKGNLVSCDLGNDSVDFYSFKNNSLKHQAQYKNEPGFGSRHLVFTKDGKHFFVAGELSSKINLVAFDEENWQFKNLATYSTIPAEFHEHNGVAAIRISDDNKFLYVSNRGHNSITVFKIGKDFQLKLLQRISTFGEFPRDFNWDMSQKWVIAANQNSNNATLYERSSELGTLALVQKDISVPEGTCVVFSED